MGGTQENVMAKGQMRGNKEVRKPKAKKPAESTTAQSFVMKGTTTPPGSPKKKG